MFSITTAKNMKRRLGEGSQLPVTKVRRIMSSLPDRMLPKTAAMAEKSPNDTAQELQQQLTQVAVATPSYADLKDFFHAPTRTEIDAYQHDILAAVRASNVDTLRAFHKQGRPMKCSNEFGESILHLACRKGLTEVAKFLVEEAKVPVQVCDDYGRNPLHDAVWVHSPNFEVMDVILRKCPDLLFIKDRRGHTPLSFARRDQWKVWNDYLKRKSPEFLVPMELIRRQQLSFPNEATNTTPAAPVVPKTILKLPSVAASGIRMPTFALPVAAKGIEIPACTSSAASAMLASAAAKQLIKTSRVAGTGMVFPHAPAMSQANAAIAASGINVLLQATFKVGGPLMTPAPSSYNPALRSS